MSPYKPYKWNRADCNSTLHLICEIKKETYTFAGKLNRTIVFRAIKHAEIKVNFLLKGNNFF